jgi:hypothetical protein
MATLRQLLVKTLYNIGEPVQAAAVPPVGTAITDNYQLQVCNYINHFKEEMEQAWQWTSRWQTFTLSYVSGNVTQQIYDQGGFFLPAGAYPYSGCKVVRIFNPKFGREVALCFDITTFGIPFVLDEMPQADLVYYNTVLNQTPVAYSTNFAVQDLGNDVVNLAMYPGANSTRNIQITLYNTQPYLDPTNGTGNQVDVWNTGNLPISLNAAPALGNTTGTLLIPWPYPTGTYNTTFTGQNTAGSAPTSQTVVGTYTNGSTAVSYSASLTYNNFSPTVVVQGFYTGGVGCDSPIALPTRPIELGTAWWCLQERGESLGAGSMFSEERYRQSLDDLIGADRNKQGEMIMIPS